MEGVIALYIVMLAAFTGYEVIAKVPVILHTPLMSGSNFVHGIVLVGAMAALGHADSGLEKTIGFIGVLLAAGNAAALDNGMVLRVETPYYEPGWGGLHLKDTVLVTRHDAAVMNRSARGLVVLD